jgi:hypothetical protein
MRHFDKTLALIAAASILSLGIGTAAIADGTVNSGRAQPPASTTTDLHTDDDVVSDTERDHTIGSGALGRNTGLSGGAMKDTKLGSDKVSLAQDHVVINFKNGQRTLSAADRNKLRTFINAAKARGDIDEIKIAVWSDKEFPATGNELPESDRTLASKRAENLENFLTGQLDVSDVETFNMAEKSNWLARTFNTDEAEIKSLFGAEGGAPIDHDEFQVFKSKGSASKAIVLVRRDLDDMGSQGGAATDGDVHQHPADSSDPNLKTY